MQELKIKTKCFNLKYTLECGQCFRWKKIDDDYYIGIIKDRVIKIKQVDNDIYVLSNKEENLEEVIKEYLSLDVDYSKIEERIVLVDESVRKAVSNTTGLRFLKQDFFETIISYIISANNNIPRISKSVNEISKRYGTKVTFNNEEYYLFPTPEQLREVSIEEYRDCGVGFRDKYIYETVNQIIDGSVKLEELFLLETKELKKSLLTIKGIGPKVADCILLFSCQRKEVFPIDTWVEKVMKKLYFENREDVSKKEIQEYADKFFKEDAGIIQQHLFYNEREGWL